MYVETMTTEEKIREFTKAFDKINEVSERILNRYLTKRKMKNNEEIDFGLHKLVINNTVYYYHLCAVKSPNINKSKYVTNLSYRIFVYTIQTHRDSVRKYIIAFYPIKTKAFKDISDLSDSDTITEIEIHVVSRYKERFLKEVGEVTLEDIHQYMKNNSVGVVYNDNKVDPIAPGNKIAKITNDGIALGIRVNKNTIKLKTFIIEEQLRGSQELWSKYGELWNAHKKLERYCLDNPLNYKGN